MANNETNLNSWLKHLPEAYAYHQVITNDAGKPVDCVYLQANPAFEAMTGLKVKEIIGRRVTEVMPGIESGDFDWIGAFGQVALTGETCQVEEYAQPLDRWYSMTAYSDEPGYFAILFHDITKQKEKEEKLEQMLHQQQQERDLFSAGPVFIIEWCMNENWPVTYVSQNVSHILGYSPEEITGPSFRYAALIHPEDVERQAAEVADYIEKGIDEFEQTYRLQTKNGAYRWFLDVSRVTRDETGLVKSIRGYLLDQTDAKIDKETLAENEKRLDMFFNQSMTGFFIMMLDEPVQWDETVDKEKALDYVFAHQRITRANQAMLDQYGATEENFINLTPNDFFAHDLDHGRQIFRDSFDNGRWHVDTHEQKIDGTPMRVAGDYICLYDEEGRITGVFGVQVDVTHRKEAEEKLQESENKYRTLFNQSVAGIYLHDLEGSILDVNQEACSQLGYTRDELLKMVVFDLHPDRPGTVNLPKDEIISFWNQWQPQQKFSMEIEQQHKDGSIIPIQLSTGIVFEKDIKRILAITQDITERKQVEAELVKAKEEAEAANRAKTQFLANMSHELRTPLNGLYGMLQLLELTDPTNEQAEYIRIALNGSQSVTRVVEDILNYTSLEKGTQKALETPFQLEEFLKEIVELHQPTAIHKGLSLSSHCGKSLPQKLVGDKFKLKQILGNLVGNAVKFTETGAVHLSARQEKADTRSGHIRISFQVKDTGIGIPPEKQDYIFQQFSQVDESHTRKYGGLGLGLAVARKQAALLGGIITAESAPGKGSVFTLTCQVGLGEEEQPLLTIPEPDSVYLPDQVSKKIKVLVVDDDYSSRMMAQLHLEKMGCQADTASNGEEALEMVTRQPYHLVLMDCQMPVMNGYEATRCIREGEKDTGRYTPIVAMTAKVLPGDQEECTEAGMDGFLAKPIERERLASLVKVFIAKK